MFAVYEHMGFQFRQFRGRVFCINIQEMYIEHGYILCYSLIDWLHEFNDLVDSGAVSIPDFILSDVA